jgi:hypothetical protein
MPLCLEQQGGKKKHKRQIQEQKEARKEERSRRYEIELFDGELEKSRN